MLSGVAFFRSKRKRTLLKIKAETEAAITKKMKEMKAEAKAKMLKVLSSKQRKILKELEGEFEEKAKSNIRL